MALTKSDKKIVRVIIRKGLMAECERGLRRAAQILDEWKRDKGNPHEAYLDLYKHIHDFNKGIARRFDGMSNSDLDLVLAQQLREGLVDRQELEAISEEGRELIERWTRIR